LALSAWLTVVVFTICVLRSRAGSVILDVGIKLLYLLLDQIGKTGELSSSVSALD